MYRQVVGRQYSTFECVYVCVCTMSAEHVCVCGGVNMNMYECVYLWCFCFGCLQWSRY